ncbi:MAG: hypothetical protein JXC32_10635 [Anaerolineae bacterium]|nr:hypothetical protein [Anaerolineae bacterium]
MDTSTLISILAFIVSVASFGLSFYATFREGARVKAISHFYPPQRIYEEEPSSPPVLGIRVANHGRRAKKLEYMVVKYANGRSSFVTETLWSSDEHGHYRIGENDVYEHTITPDNDGILSDNDGSLAVDITFEDTLNHTYRVRGAKKNIGAYLEAARQYPY